MSTIVTKPPQAPLTSALEGPCFSFYLYFLSNARARDDVYMAILFVARCVRCDGDGDAGMAFGMGSMVLGRHFFFFGFEREGRGD